MSIGLSVVTVLSISMSIGAVSNIEYFGMNIRFVPDILVVMTMRFFNYRFRLFQYKSPAGIRFSSYDSVTVISV